MFRLPMLLSDSGGASVAATWFAKRQTVFYREIGLRAPPRICDLDPPYGEKCGLGLNHAVHLPFAAFPPAFLGRRWMKNCSRKDCYGTFDRV
jgi:hypothetical protein